MRQRLFRNLIYWLIKLVYNRSLVILQPFTYYKFRAYVSVRFLRENIVVCLAVDRSEKSLITKTYASIKMGFVRSFC